MSAPAALPPTRIVSSKLVSPTDAQAFLSAFILKADTDRHTSARGELVLSDQRRIEKALEGVFIPKPVETFVVKEKAVKAPKEAAVEETAEEYEEAADTQAEETFQEEVQQQEQQQSAGGAVDKEQRKAEKKARMKAEKLEREAARLAERKR